ncbi:MAG: GNAT family N-acetyltransferase [Proteobacteria bacterium]|nr:GNAT family N-acetyltransferase [Pseudomonadota bacterium]
MNIEQHDLRLAKIVNHLKEKYDCHTIILYGSRARGDETLASDYDIIAIRDKGEMERDCRKFEGVFLDIFIYSLQEINQPSDFLRIKDGIVIYEKDRVGSDLLEKVKNCYKQGPIPKPVWEKQVIVSWGQELTEKVGDDQTCYTCAHAASTVQIIDSSVAEKICRELTAGLPEWFGIPEANERYAKGCAERTSFAAMLDNNYIGMITLEFPFKNNANIYWMAVNRKYHGQNIGVELLQAAEHYCAENAYNSITVETLSPKQNDPNYLKTYRFYEKNGFKPLFESSPYGPDILMCYMIKSINEIAYD